MSAHTFEYYEPVGYYQRGAIEDRVAKELQQHMYVSEPRPTADKADHTAQRVKRFTPGYASWPAGELTYFPVRARAEAIQLILNYSGQTYTLNSVPMAEWGAMKPTVPGGVLPAFTPDGGEMFTESIDIAKYCAKISGDKALLGGEEASKVYAVTTEGPIPAMDPLLNIKPKEECAAQGPALAKDVIKTLKTLEPLLTKDASGPYFGGKSPNIGDFAVFAAIDQLLKLEPKGLDQLGAPWKAQFDAVASLKAVKVYLECRPKAGTGKVGFPGSFIGSTDCDAPAAKVLKEYDEYTGPDTTPTWPYNMAVP